MSSRARARHHRRKDRERAAIEALALPPPPERGHHDEVERLDHSISDERGSIARPYRIVDILMGMERRGAITPDQLAAGRAFHARFRVAQLNPLRAADLGRVRRPLQQVAWGTITTRAEHARREIAETIDLLRGIHSAPGSCAWHVLGEEMSLREWGLVYRFRRRNGAASALLVEVLRRLEGLA
jgi:hypothetical protein